MKKVNIYLGASLFDERSRFYNEAVAETLRVEFGDLINLYVPQENKDINDKTKFADSLAIFNGDTNRLQNTDILFAILDPNEIGLACEIGYFSKLAEENKHKYIIAIYSDCRDMALPHTLKKEEYAQKNICENQFSYFNLYVAGAIKTHGVIVPTLEKAIKEVKVYIGNHE